MLVSKGFPETDRRAVAELYWHAFESKLARVLGPDRKALALIERALDPDYVICARDRTGNLLGVAGMRTDLGALTRDRFVDFLAVYGPFGGPLRAIALRLAAGPAGTGLGVDGLSVRPDARNRGVGTALVEAVAREALALGYDRMHLDVAGHNPRARELYARRGFESVEDWKSGVMAHLFGVRTLTRMVRRIAP